MKERLRKFMCAVQSQIPILLVLLDLHYDGVEGVNKAEAQKHLTIGNQLLHAGQLAEALTQFHASIDGDPTNYQAYYMRATVYLAMGKARAALPDLDQVINLKPNFVKARLQRGNLYLKMGKFNDAQIDYEAVLSQEDNTDAKQKVEVIRPLRRSINHASDLIKAQDYRQVIHLLKEVIETCPWNADFREMRALAHERVGDLRSAISDLKPTTTLRLDNTMGHMKISTLYYSLGEIEQSLDEIRECLKLDPDHKECYAHYKSVKKLFKTVESGKTMMKEERWDDAIGKFLKALKQEDRIPAFSLELKLKICDCSVKKAAAVEALTACKEVMKYDDHNIPALILLSEAYTLNSQYQEAVDTLQEASQIDDNYPGLGDKIKKAQKMLKQSQKRDYYKILGVSRSARKREIEKAYRKLAREWHPDNFKTEEEKKKAENKFIDLAAAKEVLTDPDKIRIYSAGYDPLDSEDVTEWEKEQEGEATDNIFKFFFHGGAGSKKKRTFDDIFKHFQSRSGNVEEDEEEEEEFLQASRRRKEEKRRREERQRMEKEEMEKKEQEERARVRKQKEQEERMRMLKQQEEERIRMLKKQEEEQMRLLKKKEDERRIQEENRRIEEMRRMEEQRKKYVQEQERKMKEALSKQERRHQQDAREFIHSSRNQQNQRRDGDFVHSENKVEEEDQVVNKKKKSKKAAGKKKKSKSKSKTKKSKSKTSKKKKKGSASEQKDSEHHKQKDRTWFEEHKDGKWRQTKNDDTYTDKDGKVFVRGADGNWYMRVETPIPKDSKPPPPERDPREDPAVKIIAGGIYRDHFGRIVDNSGNIYLKKPDGTLVIVGKVPTNPNQRNPDKSVQNEKPYRSVAAEPNKSYFHDKHGVPYYIDEQGNYVRVKGPEERKKERETKADQKRQYTYRKEPVEDEWDQAFDDIELTFSPEDLSRHKKKRPNKPSQHQRDHGKMDDIRSKIMRQQEELAKKLLDAQLREGQAYFFHDKRADERRQSHLHEEL